MRRLSAIMFTDMVGYSALAQRNESLALELLEEHRTILRPFFGKHEGREIETAGDAFFVEFNSAVEAANCAIEIQQVLHNRNTQESPERCIRLRIGLHIGDVVYMDKHVHGDGVNIAARLEPLAPPEGICISEDVERQIRNKIDYPVVKAGAEKLKNISMDMDVFYIALPWVSSSKKHAGAGKRRRTFVYLYALLIVLLSFMLFLFFRNDELKAASSTKYRLAVLPLKNISNDAGDDYFADGLTEELISSIAKIGGLNVIARTSIMKYKNANKDIAQIGSELMVGTVLEGSVRKANNKARISVQLINVSNQQNLWSANYDRELSDIFTIQSEIATNIARELKIRLVQSEKNQLDKRTTSNMEAYQEYLIGKHLLNQRTPQTVQEGIKHFEKAIELDPQFALPYPELAYSYTLTGVAGYGDVDRSVAEKRAKDAVMKALELDSTLAEAHAALAYIKFRIDWDWEGAERGFKKAIELKPGYATAHEWYALFLAVRVHLDESQRQMQIAYDLDPLSPNVNNGIARIYHFRNEMDKALQQINKTIAMDPNYAEAHFTKGMAYNKMKKFTEAETEIKKAVDLSGRRPVMVGVLGRIYAHEGKADAARQLLKELQTPPVDDDKLYAIATIKLAQGNIDEAFDIMERLAAKKYGIMVYLKVESSFFGTGVTSERYNRLVARIGL